MTGGRQTGGDILRERDALAADLESARQAARAAQSAVEAERRQAQQAEQARQDAETRAAAQLASDRDALAAAHATALTAQQQAADARSRDLRLERERAERARAETEALLAQLLEQRDGLARDLETVRRTVVDVKAGADERLGSEAAERARLETALKDAEARAQQAAQRLAAGLEEAKTGAERAQRDAEAKRCASGQGSATRLRATWNQPARRPSIPKSGADKRIDSVRSARASKQR